ncbi:MAG: 16S rRNA (cytidine(1402)-2'-O)-methyltransferase [Ignavibacteria bacterium]|nr:16S rRNA (cytidine(1402)-2'-O)-methyltransferase [Ignavibacteria bacterium]
MGIVEVKTDKRSLNGTLYLVATPIGNLEDITYRAVRILAEVDLIAAEDTRKTKILLDRYNISKPMVSYFSQNEVRRIPELMSRLQQGESIALVSDAGTPGISDPAYRIVNEAIARDITVVPIPGAAALIPALVISGLPTHAFVFEGFLPQKKGRKTRILQLKHERRTIVLYESPHRIVKTLRELHAALGNRYIVLVRELTKMYEEVLRGPIEDILNQIAHKPARGEYVIVISGVEEETDHEL